MINEAGKETAQSACRNVRVERPAAGQSLPEGGAPVGEPKGSGPSVTAGRSPHRVEA